MAVTTTTTSRSGSVYSFPVEQGPRSRCNPGQPDRAPETAPLTTVGGSRGFCHSSRIGRSGGVTAILDFLTRASYRDSIMACRPPTEQLRNSIQQGLNEPSMSLESAVLVEVVKERDDRFMPPW